MFRFVAPFAFATAESVRFGATLGAAFAAVFLTVDSFATARAVFVATDFFAASLFRYAPTMLFLPAALSFRFGLTGSGMIGDDGDSPSPRSVSTLR